MDPKKHPSLPPNYVSFLQLQQRWLQEQHRKNTQQTNQKTPKEENSNQDLHNHDTNFAKTAPIHHQNQNDVIYPKPEEQPKEEQISQKIDDLKKRKKKKNKKKNRKKSDLQEDQKPAGVSEDQNDKIEEGTGTEIKRNSEDQRLNRKVTVGKTSGLECNFVDLSLDGIRRGSKRFDRQMEWKQKDVNLVWVKKEDRIGNSITGTQSSESRPCYSEVKEKEGVGRFPPIVTRRQVQVSRREHEFDGERSKSGEKNQGTGLVVKTRVYKKIPGQWKQN